MNQRQRLAVCSAIMEFAELSAVLDEVDAAFSEPDTETIEGPSGNAIFINIGTGRRLMASALATLASISVPGTSVAGVAPHIMRSFSVIKPS